MALNPFEQLQLVLPEARQAFEDVAADLIRFTIPGSRRVRVHRGDGGVDAYNGKYGPEGEVDVYQVKYFPTVWGDPQKEQIRNSYRTARENPDYNLATWHLCIPVRLPKEDIRWFDEWQSKQDRKIVLLDGDDLATLLEREECASVRRKLREWGVMGLQAQGPRLLVKAIVRPEGPKSGFQSSILVQLENVGDRTAQNLRVVVSHAETGCVAGAHSEQWWRQSTDGLQPLNPRSLIGLHPVNPGERIPILAIPTIVGTSTPFWIRAKILGQDLAPTEVGAVISAEQLCTTANVDLRLGTAEDASPSPANKRLVPPTSEAAKAILDRILANTVLEERGLTEILQGDPGNALNAAFVPTTGRTGSVGPVGIRRRSFVEGIEELLRLGWLLPPAETRRTRVFELNPEAETEVYWSDESNAR